MFFVALLVIVLLMWKFLAFRAYMLFQMTLFAPVLIFVGAVHLGNQEYPAVGMAMLIFGNVLALLSVLTFWLSGKKDTAWIQMEILRIHFIVWRKPISASPFDLPDHWHPVHEMADRKCPSFS